MNMYKNEIMRLNMKDEGQDCPRKGVGRRGGEGGNKGTKKVSICEEEMGEE